MVIGMCIPCDNVEAYSIPNENGFITKINTLKSKYPNGGTYSGTYYEGGVARAWQCYGYAWQCAYDVFGSTQYTNNGGWTKSYTMGNLNAGDFVRINNDSHSIFITKVSGNNIYYTDANANYKNGIRWDVCITKSQMSSKFTYKWHLNGNSLTGTGAHVHNYNTYVYYWKTHPHYKCYKCSCGAVAERRSETVKITSCDECMNYANNLSEGVYYLRNKATNNYLNVAYGYDADCTQIHAYTFGNYTSQMVNIKKSTNGYEMIPCSSNSGKVVNPYADKVVSGNNVNLYHRTNDSSQWWKFQPYNGGYIVRNVQNTDVCLTVSNGNIIVSTCVSSDTQIWYLEKRYTVSYFGNGGTNVPSSMYVRSGYQNKISNQKPVRMGYTFKGWANSSKSNKVKYQPGDIIVAKGNNNLYAIWSKNSEIKLKSTKIKSASKKSYSSSAKIILTKKKEVTGYQLKVSTSKKFKKKNTLIINSKSNHITAKKLKAYKIYYVKARCYKLVGGKKYFGSWTKHKKIKFK